MQKKIETQLLSSFYSDIEGIVGKDKMLKLYEAYRGQDIYFPVKLYDRDKLRAAIIYDYGQQHSTKTIANRYGVTTRLVRDVIANRPVS